MVHLELALTQQSAERGDLAVAREALTASLSARGADMDRSRAFELTALATACLRDHDTGEGIRRAHHVSGLVADLRSVRVIDRLAPLITQLTATPGADAADVAHQLTAIGTQ